MQRGGAPDRLPYLFHSEADGLPVHQRLHDDPELHTHRRAHPLLRRRLRQPRTAPEHGHRRGRGHRHDAQEAR